MAVSSTVSVPYGRSFTSSNLGGRWAGSVAIDSEFAASGSITLTATVIRETTWWIQFNGDLELLPNTLGARNDLVVVLTHPSAGSITGDISAYLTAAQRDGTTSQATITARDTVAQTEWGRAVSDDSDALSITLSSASSGPAAPSVGPGFVLGGKQITKAYLGETEIERAYLGDTLIFGDPAPVPQLPGMMTGLTATHDRTTSSAFIYTFSWDALDGALTYEGGFQRPTDGSSYQRLWLPTSDLSKQVGFLRQSDPNARPGDVFNVRARANNDVGSGPFVTITVTMPSP